MTFETPDQLQEILPPQLHAHSGRVSADDMLAASKLEHQRKDTVNLSGVQGISDGPVLPGIRLAGMMLSERPDAGMAPNSGDVVQISRRPLPAAEEQNSDRFAPGVQNKLDQLISASESMTSKGHRQGAEDVGAGGADVGETNHGQANERHLSYLQSAKQASDDAKMLRVLALVGTMPIGNTSFTRSQIDAAFESQSLTGHIVTNFEQQFASERPPAPISVDQLAITERDGRVLLTTPEGTALVNHEGKPLMATELGSYMHKDGTILVDGAGRVSTPDDQQVARSAQREKATAGHKKEAEKVRARQEMEAALDSIASRDKMTQALSRQPEMMQAMETIAAAEPSSSESTTEHVDAVFFARKAIALAEFDKIDDSEFEVDAEDAESRPEETCEDARPDMNSGRDNQDQDDSFEADQDEDELIEDYNQREVLRQDPNAVTSQNQSVNGNEPASSGSSAPAQPTGTTASPGSSQSDPVQAEPTSSSSSPASSQAGIPKTRQASGASATPTAEPSSSSSSSSSSESSQPTAHADSIERLLNDLTQIAQEASSSLKSSSAEPGSSSSSSLTASPVSMGFMQGGHTYAAAPHVMFTTSIGEIISVCAPRFGSSFLI